VECVGGAYRVAADFGAEIPASEAVIFLAVHLPDLVDDELVVLDLVLHVTSVPVNT
jgi:hypothetical protein